MSDHDPLPLEDVPLSWPVVDSAYLHQDDWVVAFRTDTVHRPGHPEDGFRRLVVEDPGAVIILALDEHERAVVIHQYRHPVQMRLVELPAGKLDQVGEDPLVAAQRELHEEVGLVAREWTHLLTTYASPGITAETHAIYLARGLEEAPRDFALHHEEAELAVDRVPLAELVEAVLGGTVADGPLAIAVLAYEALRSRGRL
ncbi:MAG TPA: NUDIX hydrolase [Marmoricola sp.]|jgi:ADP-ribose pyrophosphatase